MDKIQHAVRKYWLWGLAVLYLVAATVYILQNHNQLQWDFKTYYYAGVAYSQGADPYTLGSLSNVAGQEIGFPFAYPPATLPVFRLFSLWFDFNTAYVIYFALKLLALAALVRIWWRDFLQAEHIRWFPLLLVLGFSGAVYLDLVSGNISIFEQLGLWAAFAALKRNRVLRFSGLVALVACFKITPILFLLLPFLLLERQWKRPLAVFFGWVLFQIVSYLTQPVLFGHFLQLASKLDERMPHNPSSLALLRDLVEGIQHRGLALPDWIAIAFFSGVVLLVGWLTWRSLNSKTFNWDQRLYLLCMAYALILPRFKNYSYILLLVPAVVFLLRLIANKHPIAMILVLISGSLPIPFGLSTPLSTLLWGYYPLLFTAVLWWFSLSLSGESDAQSGTRQKIEGV